ncbi:MAG: HU family DNA-binding protein [Terriglobia bacterium]
MKAQLPGIQTASEQLTAVCTELDRLARRIETIRNAVLTSAAAAVVATPSSTRTTSSPASITAAAPPARSSPTHQIVRKVLPPVPGLRTNPELIARVKAALMLETKKEAKIVAGAVVGALEDTLIANIGRNGFSLKLGSFGKLSIRHRLGTYRKIPLTGETRMTSTKRKVKFVAIGRLRQLERIESSL